MPDEIDWSVTTFEGNRRRQHEDFRALPFREKLAIIEDLERIARHFASRRTWDEKETAVPDGNNTETDHG